MSSNEHSFSAGTDYKGCFFASNGNDLGRHILALKRHEYDVINQIHLSDVLILFSVILFRFLLFLLWMGMCRLEEPQLDSQVNFL